MQTVVTASIQDLQYPSLLFSFPYDFTESSSSVHDAGRPHLPLLHHPASLLQQDLHLCCLCSILGMGAPILWTAQGIFLSNNSVTCNFGVFWAMNTSSTFIGNLFAYYLFKDQELIDQNNRMTLGYALTAVSVVGICLMFFLRPTLWLKQHFKDRMVTTFKDTVKLFLIRDMLKFSFTLFYTGLHQTLCAGFIQQVLALGKGSYIFFNSIS
jgi:hypothetical protein